MLHKSRNPSVGDSRYSSSMVTIKKPSIKSRLYKHKKNKRAGVTEVHSNKSNSSIRKTYTPSYMFKQGNEETQTKSKEKINTYEHLKNTIVAYHNVKKSKSKSKKKRICNRKKSINKKGKCKDIKRPGSAFGYFKNNKLRSNSSKSKHLRNNGSLYLEKLRTKENTLRHDDSYITTKNNVTRKNSKSYLKLKGFDQIMDAITKPNKGKLLVLIKIINSIVLIIRY